MVFEAILNEQTVEREARRPLQGVELSQFLKNVKDRPVERP